MYKIVLIFTAIFLISSTSSLSAQQVGAEVVASYSLPIIPLSFTVNHNGEFGVNFVPECVTPLGSFSLGGATSKIANDSNSYFVLRSSQGEAVYSVGTTGKLRLTTDGKSVIEISSPPGFPNVFIVEVKFFEGKFEAEFVPSLPPDNKVALLHGTKFTDFYIQSNGALVRDGFGKYTISSKRIINLIYGDIGLNACFVGYSYKEGQNSVCESWKFTGNSVFAAKWFYYSYSKIVPNKAKKVSQVKSWMDYRDNNVTLFDDGSICHGSIYYPSISIEKVEVEANSPKEIGVYTLKNFQFIDNVGNIHFKTDSEVKQFETHFDRVREHNKP